MLDMKYLSIPPGGGSLYSSFEETGRLRTVDAQTVVMNRICLIKKLQMATLCNYIWRGKGKKINESHEISGFKKLPLTSFSVPMIRLAEQPNKMISAGTESPWRKASNKGRPVTTEWNTTQN